MTDHVMTVGTLRRLIAGLDETMLVSFGIDAEGNGHKWVSGLSTTGVVIAPHDWRPAIAYTDDSEVEDSDPDSEAEERAAAKLTGDSCIVLHPVN